MKIGFLGALGLLFIGLKLGHVIDWPWYLVTMPLWFWPMIAVAAILALLLMAMFGFETKAEIKPRK